MIKIIKLRGLIKDQKIDYKQIEKDLKDLNNKSEIHTLEEFDKYE